VFESLSPRLMCGESWRTAAVLVEIIERVKAGLLLLICLERVAGLEIRVLHGRDPAGSGASSMRPERKNKGNELELNPR